MVTEKTHESVEKVCEFLKRRGIGLDIIAKFRSEKMDVAAVAHASNTVLETLGLLTTGDKLSVRAFCQEIPMSGIKGESNESRKRALLESILNGKKKKRIASSKHASVLESYKLQKEKKRKIQLGWLHFIESEKKLQSIRMIKGGGSREVDMALSATKDDVIQACINLFFPNGESTFAGNAANMEFGLANFKREDIESHVNLSGRDVPFTVINYAEAHKTNRIRLYLTSKCKPEGVAYDDTSNKSSKESEWEPKSMLEMEQSETICDNLIGTSEQRQVIKTAQNKAFKESLANDKVKEDAKHKALETEIHDIQRKESLQKARSLRVPKEPSPNQPSVTVQVRHPVMGLIRCRLSPSATILSVYDWVGSLSRDPEYFELYSPPAEFLAPNVPVMQADKHTLFMVECESPPSIDDDDDGTVQFKGFGQLLNSSTDTTCNLMDAIIEGGSTCDKFSFNVECVSEQPPENFMEEGSSAGEDEAATVCDPVEASNQKGAQKQERSGCYAPGRRFREMLNNGEFQWVNKSEEVTEDNDIKSDVQNNSTLFSELHLQSSQDLPESVNEVEVEEIPSETTCTDTMLRTLRIRRARVMHDIIQEFKTEDIMTSTLKFVMVDERGNDEQGVDTEMPLAAFGYRDAIGCFWKEFYDSCTLGEGERVPTLRHDFQTREWAAVARILAKGYLDLGYFPFMISQAFIISVIFNENSVSEEILLQSFKKYVAKDEKEVVCEALNGNLGEGGDTSELIDFLDRFGCRKLPTQDNVKYLILEVAHKEIIQKAQYVADSWRDVLQTSMKEKEALSSVLGLCDLYKSVEPTNKKVLSLVQAVPQTNSQRMAVDYLKRFIRGMEESELKSFLRFVTGADVICVKSIVVEFSTLEGLARRPIAHTCGSVLELPSTYDTFPEFSGEFTNILAKTKWQNDIM